MGRDKYPHLFSPLTIRKVTFPNRVLAGVVMERMLGQGVRDEMTCAADCEARARGGFGGVTLPLVQAHDPLHEVCAIRDHGAVAILGVAIDHCDERKLRGAVEAGFQAVLVYQGGYILSIDPFAGDALPRLRAACGKDAVVLSCGGDSYLQDLSGVDVIVAGPIVPRDELEELRQKQGKLVAMVMDDATPQEMEEALATGKCDLILLTRQARCDPNFLRELELDRESEIMPCPCRRPCDWEMHYNGYACVAYPRFGHEARWAMAPRPMGRRRVLVVGGGPAGLFAAVTAAERGHDVILVESCRKPGGLLWYADVDDELIRLRQFREALLARCSRLGVKLQLGTTADKAWIDRMAPDVVICAVGAAPARPDIPGIELAHHLLFAYDKPEQVGQRVLVLGNGMDAFTADDWLRQKGKEVEHLPLAEDIGMEITAEGVRYNDKDGVPQLKEADTVLYEAGQRSLSPEKLAPARGLFRMVGSCAGAKTLAEALRQAFAAAMDVV